jgi:hypothetical protein
LRWGVSQPQLGPEGLFESPPLRFRRDWKRQNTSKRFIYKGCRFIHVEALNPVSTSGSDWQQPKTSPNCTQNATQLLPENADLAAVVKAWDRLPEANKAGIVAMVKAASK